MPLTLEDFKYQLIYERQVKLPVYFIYLYANEADFDKGNMVLTKITASDFHLYKRIAAGSPKQIFPTVLAVEKDK